MCFSKADLLDKYKLLSFNVINIIQMWKLELGLIFFSQWLDRCKLTYLVGFKKFHCSSTDQIGSLNSEESLWRVRCLRLKVYLINWIQIFFGLDYAIPIKSMEKRQYWSLPNVKRYICARWLYTFVIWLN